MVTVQIDVLAWVMIAIGLLGLLAMLITRQPQPMRWYSVRVALTITTIGAWLLTLQARDLTARALVAAALALITAWNVGTVLVRRQRTDLVQPGGLFSGRVWPCYGDLRMPGDSQGRTPQGRAKCVNWKLTDATLISALRCCRPDCYMQS
jgi:hypothetical protein